tara:strand:+ start:635 stop:901 length:267 start_codon:yes stop_codon:yes gene_type:complete
MKSLFLVCLLMVVSACNAAEVAFEKMSEDELLAYNGSVGYLDFVHCSDDVRLGSFIRKRSCLTMRDILEGGISRLNTPSSSLSITFAK